MLIEIGDIVLRSLVSLTALFFLAKLIGAKQISQLTFFDYVVGISIGSISGEMAFSREVPYAYALTSMAVYGLVAIGISWITQKSILARRFFTGTSILLIDKGVILYQNMKKVKYDVNDLLSECRVNGYFNICDIEFAIMETNGRISFLPKSQKRPVTPEDMGLSPEQEGLQINVIIDGNVMEANLRATGNNWEWLKKQLENQGIQKAEDVLLAVCSPDNQLCVFLKNRDTHKNNLFE